MVDKTVAAAKVAAIREAVARIRTFRNLVAHRYGVLDPSRVHSMAATELDDLIEFADVVSREISEG